MSVPAPVGITRPNTRPAHNVFNLSTTTLTADEVSLLAKGLNFCPSYIYFDYTEFHAQIHRFIRRLKLFDYFREKESQTDEDLIPTPKAFRRTSTWTPEDHAISTPILALTLNLEKQLYKIRVRPQLANFNLTQNERSAIRKLKNNTSIIIRPADKGSGTVIMAREEYIRECLSQLSDPTYYRLLDTDPLEATIIKVNRELDKHCRLKWIPKEVHSWIYTPNPRSANFYILPKIHKSIDKPPGRPILSANGHPTERISAYLDHFLNPIMQELPTFIKDTGHLIQLLSNWKPPSDTPTLTLVSFDVKSLYTCIPHEEGIETVKRLTYAKYRNHNLALSLSQLTRIILYNNILYFNGQHYTQVHGVAMGSRFSPAYACCFLSVLENNWLRTGPIRPIFWKRYIDDILAIFPNPIQEIKELEKWINDQHPTIKVTLEHQDHGIPFLDTFLTLTPSGIRIRPYTKPTDTKLYLHPQSLHPEHTINGIPYAQALRISRICSDPTDLDLELKILESYFLKRHYKPDLVSREIQRAKTNTLQLTSRPPTTLTGVQTIPLIVTYHKNIPNLSKIIHQCIHETTEDFPELENIIQGAKLLTAYKKPPNLRDLLVTADITARPRPMVSSSRVRATLSCSSCCFSRQFTTTDPHTLETQFQALSDLIRQQLRPRGCNKPCNNRRCKSCPRLHTDPNFLHNTPRIYPLSTANCASPHIIYSLTCTHCNLHYVGLTSRNLKERMSAHRYHIKNPNSILHNHLHAACPTRYRIAILAAPQRHLLETMESLYIWLLDTIHPKGLNAKHEHLKLDPQIMRFGRHYLHDPRATPILRFTPLHKPQVFSISSD